MNKTPQWSKQLSSSAWVNSVAISDDASRVVGGSFVHDYTVDARGPNQWGIFGTFGYDAAGTLLWSDTYAGWDGVFAVGLSGDGRVAAAGGWYDKARGLLRAYDANTGERLLDCTTIPKRVSLLGLSRDGGVLAGAADKVYVFARRGNAYLPVNHPSLSEALDGCVTAVAVHPSGAWLVACDKSGHVLLATVTDDKILNAYPSQVPHAAIDRTNPASPTAPIPLLSVAIAEESESFVVGGGDFVYLFTKDGIRNGKDPIQYDTWDPYAPRARAGASRPAENVRWLSISATGFFFTVVANRKLGNSKTGMLLAYRSDARSPAWRVPLPRNPNGTSTDPGGRYVAVADGYPVGSPASFYLFDASGNEVGDCPTANMNWPIFISANGLAIAAGGDDGKLYYFQPKVAS